MSVRVLVLWPACVAECWGTPNAHTLCHFSISRFTLSLTLHPSSSSGVYWWVSGHTAAGKKVRGRGTWSGLCNLGCWSAHSRFQILLLNPARLAHNCLRTASSSKLSFPSPLSLFHLFFGSMYPPSPHYLS